jgi:transcriptional regulator with XRE-family HTH domain
MTRSEWKNIFANNLVDILQEHDMTQSELAKRAGISVSRINDYVKENATPSIFAIINIAYALDMDITELVDFEDTID